MHKNQVFLSEKPWKKSATGTIDYKTTIYQDKRLRKNILPGLEPEKVEKHCLKAL